MVWANSVAKVALSDVNWNPLVIGDVVPILVWIKSLRQTPNLVSIRGSRITKPVAGLFSVDLSISYDYD
jgi:hypothetical protein